MGQREGEQMNRLLTSQEIVENLLIHFPETRDNDCILYAKALEYFGRLYEIDFSRVSILSAYNNKMIIKGNVIPTIETLGRCRRKLQEEHPEYRASDKAKACRDELEEEFREYARS